MPVSRHYNNAPITEALIDIHVQLPSGADLNVLDRFRSAIAATYPREEKRIEFQAQFVAGESPDAKSEQKQIGYAFYSSDGRQVVQGRLNGFTFSRLAPYKDWEHMRDEARKQWSLFVELVRPEKIAGVVLRYINQIRMPAAEVDLKQFFRTYPEIAPELSQTMSGYYMSVQVPQLDLDCVLVLTQTTVPAQPGSATVVLDQFLSAQNRDIPEDELWSLLEKFRNRKNEIFEYSITDKTRELFA